MQKIALNFLNDILFHDNNNSGSPHLMLDERVPSDLKKNLMQARLDKKMTQAQLAQVLCGIIKFQNFNSSILS
jgi:hypothetical protein